MKRIWLQNESDKLFAERQWCEDKVWDDEDCTAYILEDEAQAIIDEAVELLRDSRREHLCVEDGWHSCPKEEDYIGEQDRSVCLCGADEWNARIDDFIAKHGREREEG